MTDLLGMNWDDVLMTVAIFILGYQTGWYAGRRL